MGTRALLLAVYLAIPGGDKIGPQQVGQNGIMSRFAPHLRNNVNPSIPTVYNDKSKH